MALRSVGRDDVAFEKGIITMSPVKISSPPPRFLLISSEACNNLHLRHRQSRHSWHSWHRRDKLILLCLGEPVLTQNTTCVDMRPPWIWISLWKAGSPHLELEKQPANATVACMTSTQLTKFCRFATKRQFPPAEHRLGEARRPGQVVRGNTEKEVNDLW